MLCYKIDGARDASVVTSVPALPEDLGSAPKAHTRQLTAPISLAPRDLTLGLNECAFIMHTDSHTNTILLTPFKIWRRKYLQDYGYLRERNNSQFLTDSQKCIPKGP